LSNSKQSKLKNFTGPWRQLSRTYFDFQNFSGPWKGGGGIPELFRMRGNHDIHMRPSLSSTIW